jgi:hypothetical protein
MKKIIRLTESDLTRIVRRTLNEMEDKNWDDHKEENDFSYFDTDMYNGLDDEEWGETDGGGGGEELQDLIKDAKEFLENECGYDLDDINLMSVDDIVDTIFDEGNIVLAQKIDNLLDFDDFNFFGNG